jgi:hypothetical protein
MPLSKAHIYRIQQNNGLEMVFPLYTPCNIFPWKESEDTGGQGYRFSEAILVPRLFKKTISFFAVGIHPKMLFWSTLGQHFAKYTLYFTSFSLILLQD